MKTLQVITTSTCNLGCRYCYTHDDHSNITLDNFDVQFSKICENTNESFKISFFGGEPLLNFDVIRNIVLKYNLHKNIDGFGISTNGLLITQEIVDFIKKYKINFSFSMDGLNTDISRPEKNQNTLNKYIELLPLLRQLTHYVSFSINIDTYKNLHENYVYLLDTFHMIPRMEIMEDPEMESIDLVIFKSQINKVINEYVHRLENNYENCLPNVFKTFINSINIGIIKRRPIVDCFESKEMICIDGKSEYPCAKYKYQPISINNRDQINNICKKCEVYHICPKRCLHTRTMLGYDIYDSKVCDIYKIMLETVIILNNRLRDNNMWQSFMKKLLKDEINGTIN